MLGWEGEDVGEEVSALGGALRAAPLHLLGLQSEGNHSCSQWGRGRAACVSVSAAVVQISGHLGRGRGWGFIPCPLLEDAPWSLHAPCLGGSTSSCPGWGTLTICALLLVLLL